MLRANNPDAACMYEIHRKDGEKDHCCILSRLEIKANLSRITLLCECLVYFAGRVDVDFFVRFDNTASCITARRHADSRNSVCLRSRALIDTYLLCRFVQGG